MKIKSFDLFNTCFNISEEGMEKKTEPKPIKVEHKRNRRNSQELIRQLNIVRGRSPQSDETKRTRREATGAGMREMVPKSFSFSDAFFQYSNGRIFSGSERLYITGVLKINFEILARTNCYFGSKT